MLYVCLSSEGVANAMRQLGNEKFAELRVDLVKPSMDEMREMLACKQVSYIVTCRPGAFSEEASMEYLIAAARCGAKYVDLEIERGAGAAATLAQACEQSGCKLIISYHNFSETPCRQKLLEIVDCCFARKAGIVKLACAVNSPADNAAILSLYQERQNIVAFGMGPLGKISRLASLKCGAEFTYVASGAGSATAPGQFTAGEMRRALEMLA